MQVLGKPLHEHQAAHQLGGGGKVLLLINRLRHGLPGGRLRLLHIGCKRLQLGRGFGIVQFFAPLHLLHQKIGGHGGVVFCSDGLAVQFAQVGRALEWIAQALAGFVDAYRPLQRQPLGGGALCGKFVGVGLALQNLPACIDLCAIQHESPGKIKQYKVVVLQIHGFCRVYEWGRCADSGGWMVGKAWRAEG